MTLILLRPLPPHNVATKGDELRADTQHVIARAAHGEVVRPAPQEDPDTVEAVFEVLDHGDGRHKVVYTRMLTDLLERELELLVLTVGLVTPEFAKTVRHGGRDELDRKSTRLNS